MPKSDDDRVAVLFSGGRDSTLATLRLFRQNAQIVLIGFESGLGVGGDLRDARVEELRTSLADGLRYEALRVHGLVRRLCFVDLVPDVQRDQCQLILLGEFLAMLTAAVGYCRRHEIRRLAFGATAYQNHLPEQQPESLDVLSEFTAGYGIRLELPVADVDSELDVKIELAEAGLIPKSLEGYSVLADIDDRPPADVVRRYVERKLPMMTEVLAQQGVRPVDGR